MGPISCITPAGDRVRVNWCCSRGHATVAQAKAHAAKGAADVLGLGKILTQVRRDTTYPGDPGGVIKGGRMRAPCVITDTGADDEIWIAETARQGWLIITQDSAIQDNRREIEAVRDSNARMIALTGADATDTFSQLEVLMRNWRAIEVKLDEAGPFIYAATRTAALRPVSLDLPLRSPPRESADRLGHAPHRPKARNTGAGLAIPEPRNIMLH